MILDHSISNVSMILDHSISNVCSFKYLGIHISSDFTWTDHIEHLTGKVSQRLGLLKRIKHLLPFRARLLFYKSLVMPLFEYADLSGAINIILPLCLVCKFCKIRPLKLF